jgi:uncharacterized repeat protein (TIGR02543 family)
MLRRSNARQEKMQTLFQQLLPVPLRVAVLLVAGLGGLLAQPAAAQSSGYLWLYSNVNGNTDTFEKINPITGALVQTITHSSSSAPLPQGGSFSTGGGYLWLYSNVGGTTDTFEKIDPNSGALVQTVTHSSSAAPLRQGGQFAYGGGYLWLYSNVNGTTDTFEKIDPATGALIQTVTHSSTGAPLPTGGSLSVGDGYLWLYANVNGASDIFEKIVPGTGALGQTITHSSTGAPLATGGKFAYGGLYLWLYSNVSGTTDTFEKINLVTGILAQTVTHSSSGAPLGLGANFGVESQWPVMTSSSPASGGTIVGGGTYDDWATATVTADAGSCYYFVNWTAGATVVSTNPSYSFVVSADETLVANFTIFTYGLTTSSAPLNGGATVGGGTFDCGQAVQISATASSGYVFNGWTGTGSGAYSGTNNPASVTVAGDLSETANFVLPPNLYSGLSKSGVVIAWPTNYLGFSLRSTNKLNASGIWPPYNGTPPIVGTNYQVTISPAGSVRFFRLQK